MSAGQRVASTLLATAVIALAGSGVASAACPGQDVRALTQSDGAIEASLLCLINERRGASGVGVVRHNAQLATAADRHARDMVVRGFFSHVAPGGPGFIERIVSTGYTDSALSWIVGENLVWGSGSLSTPRQLVQSWMDSPPHRANLLRPRFDEIGLGSVHGTPSNALDLGGVTVASEYGHRDNGGARPPKAAKKKRKKKGARKSRAAKRRAARHGARS
jgi:uncharacterized protein YkwD